MSLKYLDRHLRISFLSEVVDCSESDYSCCGLHHFRNQHCFVHFVLNPMFSLKCFGRDRSAGTSTVVRVRVVCFVFASTCCFVFGVCIDFMRFSFVSAW